MANGGRRTALVTGGGSGIGKMIAAGLVANGAKVYIAARKEGQLKAVSSSPKHLAPSIAYTLNARSVMLGWLCCAIVGGTGR